MSDPKPDSTPEVKDVRISDEDIEKISKMIEEKIPKPPKPTTVKETKPSDSKQTIKDLEAEVEKLQNEKRERIMASLELTDEQTEKYKDASIDVLEAVLDFKTTGGKAKGVSKKQDKTTPEPTETAADRLAATGKTGNWNHITRKWE